MSKFNGKKTNNAKNTSKQQIRENILLHFTGEKKVLEVFCGSGEMYKEVWKKSDFYTGIDIESYNDERITICGDSLKELKKIDINNFNIFDIDAYGSPYSELKIILDKLQNNHKEIAFILTDGIDIDMRMGNIEIGLQSLLGIKNRKLKNAHLMHDTFIKSVIKKIIDIFKPINHKMYFTKGIKGSGMRYYAIYLQISK